MGKVYAVVEGDNTRVLVQLECDRCDATIKPNPDISKSGWRMAGFDHGPGTEQFVEYFCPECWERWEKTQRRWSYGVW